MTFADLNNGVISRAEGFNSRETQVPVKHIVVNAVKDHLQFINENYIKDDLKHELMKELMNNNCIEFRSEQSPQTMETHYRARLSVADRTFSNIIVSEKCFNVGSEEFTEAEIKIALENYYPERMI